MESLGGPLLHWAHVLVWMKCFPYIFTNVLSLFGSHLTLDLTLGVASYKSFILLLLFLLLLILFLLFKDRVSHMIAQAGMELAAILLLQPPKG